MTRRSYTGAASSTTLAAPMLATDTTASLASGANLPTSNFVLTLDQNLAGEEKVLVGTRTGTALTGITRGFDGTAAASHSAGATVLHTISATDLDEANAHVNATTGVHGITGAVVGTTDTQTLTNKTLTAPVIGDFSNAAHTHTTTATGGLITFPPTESRTWSKTAPMNSVSSATAWQMTGSFSAGASATYPSSPNGPTQVTGSTGAAGVSAISFATQFSANAPRLRKNYLEMSVRWAPFLASVASGFSQWSWTTGAGTDASAATDSLFIQVNQNTGALTFGGRANSVSQTATTFSPPTIAASTGYDVRLQWPIAGGTGNVFVNDVLVATVPSLRAYPSVVTSILFNYYVNSGASAASSISYLWDVTVSDAV